MEDGLAVVVGGANGIGEAIVRHLVAERACAQVMIADLDLGGARRLAGALGGHGVDVLAHEVDVCDSASVQAMVDKTASASWLVVSSGIFATAGALSVTREEFRRTIRVNCEGTFFVAQAYAREMVTNRRGSILALASVAARVPRISQAAYGASKAGLRQALRILALEVAEFGVRVNTLSPGLTQTGMMKQLALDTGAPADVAAGDATTYRARVPRGTVASADDIAAVATFLLLKASHMTIQDVVVDGGELLGMSG